MSARSTILAIDDDELTLKLLDKHLSPEFNVVCCTNVTQAIQLFNQVQPNLVLLDLHMPEIDGYECLTMLRRDPHTTKLPVIVLTAHASDDEEVKALLLGANDFIHKPVKQHVLRLRVKNQLALANERIKNQKLIDELAFFASTDVLTQVNNRFSFLKRSEAEIKRCERFERPFSLIMLDIDDFKQVNDQYGHAAGDDVLAALAQLLLKELRDMDIIGRLGGKSLLFYSLKPN